MKLISILRAMDEEDEIIVNDENAPIDKMCLFKGDVKECKKQGYFRNGVVTALLACDNVLIVAEKKNKELKAENERLQCQVNRLKKYDEERDIRLHARLIATARAEAIKEFVEIIVADYPEMEYYLENIAKEMVGESV